MKTARAMRVLRSVFEAMSNLSTSAVFWLIALIALAAAFFIAGAAVLAGTGWALIVAGLSCLTAAVALFIGVQRHA